MLSGELSVITVKGIKVTKVHVLRSKRLAVRSRNNRWRTRRHGKIGRFDGTLGTPRFVLLAIVIYRIGAHIPVPGINPDRLAELFEANSGTILSLFNMFSGGALSG